VNSTSGATTKLLAWGTSFTAPHVRRKFARSIAAAFWLLLVTAVAIVLTAIAVAMDTTTPLTLERVIAACLGSVASGLFGTMATVVSLETLRARRTEKEQRVEYLNRLRSTDRSVVAGTIEELRSKKLIDSGYLDGADLRGVDFSGLDLRSARLVGAKLDGADLRGTMLYGADLRYTSLKDAQVSDKTNLHLCKCTGAVTSGISDDLLKLCGLPQTN
jgi:hypothetical protein